MRYVLAILVLVFAASLLTAVTFVRPGERVMVRRFGKVIATPGPGLYVGLPWGLDRIDRIPVDLVRRVTVGYQPDDEEYGRPMPGQLLTGDHNLVNVQVVVHYSVEDHHLIDFIEQAERADGLIARAAESVLAEWIAGREVDEVLGRGKLQLPAEVADGTQQRIAPYRLGVRINDVSVAHLTPPREVKSAFDEVNRVQTSIETQKQNALQDAARKRREAQTQKFQLERATEAYVKETHQLAAAEAARFEKRLTQYDQLKQHNPNALSAIWWDEMGTLLRAMKAKGRIDLLDHHLGPDGLDITTVTPPLKKP
jgi:membrane protease subunit HflK